MSANPSTTGETKNRTRKLDGSTHKAIITTSPGGVGYNIAQCLQKLGTSPVFITCGASSPGRDLDMRTPGKPHDVATYVGVLDPRGECRIGFGDMKAHDTITPELVEKNIKAFEEAPIILMDGNIPVDTMNYIFKIAEDLGKPVFFEPTDIRKATRPFQTASWKPLKFISPNLNELAVIGEYLGYEKRCIANNMESILKTANHVGKYVDNCIITMGKNGVLLVTKNTNVIKHYELPIVAEVINVSGAGDCFVAGFVTAMLLKKSEDICMSVAYEAARKSLISTQSVPDCMFGQENKCWQRDLDYKIFHKEE